MSTLICKKYERIKQPDSDLYRIRALRDFADVKAGDLGGYIMREYNLSQDGNCWIYDNSRAVDCARVSGDARVISGSTILDCALVTDQAVVTNCTLKNHVRISNQATVNDIFIEDRIRIGGDASIDTSLDGFLLHGMASFHRTPTNYIVLGPIGSRKAYTTFYATKDYEIWVDTGCYSGEIHEFAEQVTQEHYGSDMQSYKEYMAAIKVAKKILSYKNM